MFFIQRQVGVTISTREIVCKGAALIGVRSRKLIGVREIGPKFIIHRLPSCLNF